MTEVLLEIVLFLKWCLTPSERIADQVIRFFALEHWVKGKDGEGNDVYLICITNFLGHPASYQIVNKCNETLLIDCFWSRLMDDGSLCFGDRYTFDPMEFNLARNAIETFAVKAFTDTTLTSWSYLRKTYSKIQLEWILKWN